MRAQTYCVGHTAYRQCKKSTQATVQANHSQCLVVVDDCVQVYQRQQRIGHSRMQKRDAYRCLLLGSDGSAVLLSQIEKPIAMPIWKQYGAMINISRVVATSQVCKQCP